MTVQSRISVPVRQSISKNMVQMLIILAAIYPLIILLDAYWLGTRYAAGWLLIMLSMGGLGTILRTAGTARESGWKWITGLLFYVVLAGLALGWLYIQTSSIALLVMALVLGVAGMIYGIALATGQWEKVFPLKWQLILLGITWIAYLAAGRNEGMDEIRGSIYAAGAISIFAILFRLGSQQIDSIAFEEGFSLAALRAVVRRSRSWIWLIVVLIAIIGGSSQLSTALRWLWHRLMQMLTPHEPPRMSEPANVVNPPMLPPMDLPKTDTDGMNPFILEKIAQIAMLLAITAFAGLIGWMVYRLIRKYAPRLYRWLTSLWGGPLSEDSTEPKGYTDHMEKMEKSHPSRLRWNRHGESIPSDAPGRVRYHYRQLVRRARKKGIAITAADTPADIAYKLSNSPNYEQSDRQPERSDHIDQTGRVGIQRLIGWYNDVRYGNHSVSEEDLEQWEQQQKKSK
ncbi:DUF4129 domain-containing protein [Paenibacillus dauci]|uniref:DUF4129 domain-containing protein n=1 Tax=Paenibacillus dauci TaxID=1567106 RepID=UPI000619CD72|nr:DUF4129 domain-containing protein [Paenibacillus dauci]